MSESRVFALPSRRATIHFARAVAETLVASDLLILSGPLGAGKTFFTRALLRAAGVPRETRITSPTFSLVHELETPSLKILHIDLYRLRDPSELRPLGLYDARKEGAALVVEWGAPHAEDLGGATLSIAFDRSGGSRSVTITGPDAERISRIGQGFAAFRARRSSESKRATR